MLVLIGTVSLMTAIINDALNSFSYKNFSASN